MVGISFLFHSTRISKIPRISRKWTFLKRPLFPNPILETGSQDAVSKIGSRPNTKDRGRKVGSQTAIIAICFGLLGPFQTIIMCTEIKQKQPQDRKTVFETLSLPVAKILSPVARQAPTKRATSRKACLAIPDTVVS